MPYDEIKFQTNIPLTVEFSFDTGKRYEHEKYGTSFVWGIKTDGKSANIRCTTKLYDTLIKAGAKKGVTATITKKDDDKFQYFKVQIGNAEYDSRTIDDPGAVPEIQVNEPVKDNPVAPTFTIDDYCYTLAKCFYGMKERVQADDSILQPMAVSVFIQATRGGLVEKAPATVEERPSEVPPPTEAPPGVCDRCGGQLDVEGVCPHGCPPLPF